MVAQNTLRIEKQVFFINFKFDTAIDLNKCLINRSNYRFYSARAQLFLSYQLISVPCDAEGYEGMK